MSDRRQQFIHSFYFYSASSSPLLLRGSRRSADIVSEFHAEAPQTTESEGLGLPKVLTLRLERISNSRPFGRKASHLRMSHHAPRAMSFAHQSWSGTLKAGT